MKPYQFEFSSGGKTAAINHSQGLILSLLIALVFVFMTFSPDFVMGTAAYWQTQNEDVTQYIAGFNSYYASKWQHPLLAFNGFNYPNGTLATFVDVIPIYSILLKALVPASFAPFNPFGFWVAACFLMQGVAAWWLVKELRIKSWIFLITLTFILVSFPALMTRLGHISLMSHWIVLFAFALYVRGHRKNVLPILGWSVLLVSSFYVNIYLFVMASGIYCAALLDPIQFVSWRKWWLVIMPCFILIGSLFITMLPLPPGEVTQEWGFGYFSMNLLSPLLGGAAKNFDKTLEEYLLSPVLGGIVVNIPYKTAPGQYEGFNYLGLGVLLATLFSLIIIKGKLIEIIKRHMALFVLLLTLTAYALSDHIYLGESKIVSLHYPTFFQPITSQFRASGRFFWPVGYCIVIFSLYIIYIKTSLKVMTTIFIVLMLLQGFDLHNLHQMIKFNQAKDSEKFLNKFDWDKEIKNEVSKIYFYPKFKCGKGHSTTLLPVMKYAAERNLKMNTGYIARYTPDCNNMEIEIENSEKYDAAYVFVMKEYQETEKIMNFFPPESRPKCNVLDFAMICQYAKNKGAP
jgi:Family of unknown function (DUF6311)